MHTKRGITPIPAIHELHAHSSSDATLRQLFLFSFKLISKVHDTLTRRHPNTRPSLLERRASILCPLRCKRLAGAFRLLGGNEDDIPRQKLERAPLGEPTFLRFFVVINFFQFLS